MRESIERFYAAAGDADESVLAEVLHPDVRHFLIAPDPGDEPVVGAAPLIESIAGAARALGARWSVDHLLVAGGTACVEWSMTTDEAEHGAQRGCEWVELDGARIDEFRSYAQTGIAGTELDGYPYAQGIPDAAAGAASTPRAGADSERLPGIIAYYDACTAADAEALARFFTDDVVHYFVRPNVGSAPVRGREHLARYWRKVARLIDARWVVESIIERGDEAVIEWSMYWAPAGGDERIVTRGTEWYLFRDGLIAEIRSYHRQLERSTELGGFPYADRGYSTLGHEASNLHPGVGADRQNG
ncbi:nuclear transport factor 2 family protein [Cumulibacter manganitolerans]|uniref:nuclear transport factor 2 family protein n=1 Tax=Cumulibacter manganitolerans TaxID=1884992 RepID=UPI001296CB08|nr:nuclear transport factor 2 family protein [Cumulibacter manganitolerans]